MGIPYLQIEADFITSRAQRIAAPLRVHRHVAIGMAADLFAFAITETSTKDKPPDGMFVDPDAEAILEGVMGWSGEPGRAIEVFVRAGVIARMDIGLRVRGMERYRRTWEKNRRNKGPGSGANGAGKTPETGTQNAGEAPLDGDGDGDGDLDPLPSEEGRESAAPPLALVAPAPEPVEALRDAWNTLTAPPLPRWQEMGDKRRKAAKARLRERPLAEWREVIQRIAQSSFCQGENGRGWAAGPDFLLRPDTAAKVLEGTYDNRQRAGPGRDIRRGVARAEDQDHERNRVDADGTIDL